MRASEGPEPSSGLPAEIGPKERADRLRVVVDAVNCAIEIQRAMVERNAEVAPVKRIEFRIGIHVGDVVEESDGDLMGDGVNIAARLQGVAKPAGIPAR